MLIAGRNYGVGQQVTLGERIVIGIREYKIPGDVGNNAQVILSLKGDQDTAPIECLAFGVPAEYEELRGHAVSTGGTVMKLMLEDLTSLEVVELNAVNPIERISTLDKSENIKLYSEAKPTCESTIAVGDIAPNSVYDGVLLFVQSIELKPYKDKGGRYAVFSCLDKNCRGLKLFRHDIYNFEPSEYEGNYCRFNFTTNATGFCNISDFLIEKKGNVSLRPDVEVAYRYMEKVLENDPALKAVDLTLQGGLNTMRTRQYDDNIETGYGLVKLAKAVYLALEADNVSPIVNTTSLVRVLYLRELGRATYGTDNIISLEDYTARILQILRQSPNARDMAEVLMDKRVESCLSVGTPPIIIIERKLAPLLEEQAALLVNYQYGFESRTVNNKLFD